MFIYFACAIFSVCLVAVLAISVRYVKNLKAINRKIQLEQTVGGFLFDHMNCAWCYWFEGDTFIQSSQKFRELFQFDANTSVHVNDVMSLFGESPFESFQRALSHLVDYGGEFTLQNTLKDSSIVLEIHGQCLKAPKQNTSIDDETFDQLLYQRRIVMLIFNDVTLSSQERLAQQTQQKEKLQELESLRNIANSIPMALWCRDSKGRVQYCNTIYADSLETTPHRVIAENREFIEGQSKYTTYDLSQLAIENGQQQVVRTHTVIAGQRRLMEVSEIPLGDGCCTVGYALDVTEVEELEDEFLNHRKAFHEVLDQISTPIAIYSADTCLSFFNQSYVKLFDFDEAFLYSRPTLGEVLEDLRARRRLQEYQDFLGHKRERMNLFKNLFQPIHEVADQPDGRTLRLMIAPYPLGGLLYIFEDITDKLILERGYNTLMAVQRETLDHLYEGVLVFGSDNRLRLSNPAMGRIWHLSDEKRASGRHINDVLKDVSHLFNEQAESKIWRKRMTEIVSLRKPQKGTFVLRNDQVIDYAYVPLPDGSHMMSFVDASDRWRFEQSLKERTVNLEQADHLKTTFISHVSYELRSPLNTISGFSEILMNQYFGPLNERQMDYCHGIRDSSEQLISLINDMIDLASIEAGTFNLQYQEVVLEKFLTSVVNLVYNRANDQGLELKIDNTCTHKVVSMDGRRLKHALFNLLSTSIKFTPHGGRIYLKAEDGASGFLKISVEDSSGLDHAPQNKYGASDVGFALVQKLVNLHGGDVIVSSAEEGTLVSWTIPVEKASS